MFNDNVYSVFSYSQQIKMNSLKIKCVKYTKGKCYNKITCHLQDLQDHLLDFNPDSLREDAPAAAAVAGVVLPPIQCPLGPQAMAGLTAAINPNAPSQDNGRDIYKAALDYVTLHSNFAG